jgi:AraC-like DNA-binding protein
MGHERQRGGVNGRRKGAKPAGTSGRSAAAGAVSGGGPGKDAAAGPARTEAGGLKSQPPGYRFSASNYDIFQVIFVSGGELFFENEAGCRKLGPGETAVLRRGSSFALSSPRGGYGGVFYIDLKAGDPAQSGGSAVMTASRPLKEIASLIQHYLFAGGVHSEAVITALCRSLGWAALRQLAEAVPPPINEPASYWAERIVHAVNASLYGSNDAFRERIAALPLSYKQLNRYCKQSSGTTMKEFHKREKLREAERLLSGSSLSITDIAIELHFASSQKLAARFKEYYGKSPSEYRREYRGN